MRGRVRQTTPHHKVLSFLHQLSCLGFKLSIKSPASNTGEGLAGLQLHVRTSIARAQLQYMQVIDLYSSSFALSELQLLTRAPAPLSFPLLTPCRDVFAPFRTAFAGAERGGAAAASMDSPPTCTSADYACAVVRILDHTQQPNDIIIACIRHDTVLS